MTPVNQSSRSINIKTMHILGEHEDLKTYNWQTGGFLSFQVYDRFNAWYGRLPRQTYRRDWPHDGEQSDLSGFDALIKLLQPVPREQIYPEFDPGKFLEYNPAKGIDSDAVYVKAPNLHQYKGNGSQDLAARLFAEVMIHEKVRGQPHPNLITYLGCKVDNGRIVQLVFEKYHKSLRDHCRSETATTFTYQHRMSCIEQVEKAAAHLHSLGLAHNDISPANIMFTKDMSPVLIDLDSCAPIGAPIKKGGLVTGWKGPIAGQGRRFTSSSLECDTLAIEAVRNFLVEDFEKKS